MFLGRTAFWRWLAGAGAALAVLTLVRVYEVRAGPARPAIVPESPGEARPLELARPTRSGAFFDVLGRRAAVFGYENRAFEAWVYPIKVLDDFTLAFHLEGYPLDIPGADIAVAISVRPEATTFTYSHAAFTARQTIFAPIDEPGVIMLIDVDTTLPLRVAVTFRPRLRLMWPAGLMTGNLGWDSQLRAYALSEETNRFAAVVGSPDADDLSVMPYQEEPRDVPVRFVTAVRRPDQKASVIPIVIAGSVSGVADAKARYRHLVEQAGPLYEGNVQYYRDLDQRTASITTPDARLNTAFRWAKIGIDKGIVTNPQLGTGLVAGFRTSGDSERPGFAWFFGRDALWTALAMTSYGDYAATRTALDFLAKFQRADGKIPHEISQSAAMIPWFTDYPYPWASADATPLYIIAHADYWRASGDLEYLRRSWPSIVKARAFTAATDADGNGLIENTGVGHGWVEGGALYPPHEEIYMQGLWIEAERRVAEMADALGDSALAASARTAAERTRTATESTFWLADRGFYAFATATPRDTPREAEPGPHREARQARLNALQHARLIDEDTVLPAVPLWWRTLEDARAQSQIDHLGSGNMATDWGARILSDRSQLYDPLSYHYGSVWPLFTGWASMGAYQYGRPHVGYQALMANALLTEDGALGYVTELLSGDFNAAFGRSSHHQVWSEAMVITPVVRGLLGWETESSSRSVRVTPRLPIHWNRVEARSLPAGEARFDLLIERASERLALTLHRRAVDSTSAGVAGVTRLVLAPALPLDATVRAVTVNGRAHPFKIVQVGDVQHVEVAVSDPSPDTSAVYTYTGGTDVYSDAVPSQPGSANRGLRILRSHATAAGLNLVLEGLSGTAYRLRVRTPHLFAKPVGVSLTQLKGQDPELEVAFEGPERSYVRREITLPFMKR